MESGGLGLSPCSFRPFTFQSLRFPICIVGIKAPALQGCCEDTRKGPLEKRQDGIRTGVKKSLGSKAKTLDLWPS
jgi:hypothetical protein